jgi:uncharacterized protein (TIGR03000 family)
MHRTRTLLRAGVACLTLLALTSQLRAQDEAPVRLLVYVPPGAQIVIDGTKTTSTGEVRRFVSPALRTGQNYSYHLVATWTENGREVVRREKVTVQPGRETVVDFRNPGRASQPPQEKTQEPDKQPDVIFVPTPQAVVDKMLEMAQVKKGDVVYDLGCGDGRIVVSAAKRGARAYGFDVDPQRIKESRANVERNGVEGRATITRKDIFTLDLSPANVVTLYLLADLNVKLIPQLEKLKPGSRIVSHDFDMRGVKPKQVVRVKAKDDDGEETEHTIYLWVAPIQKE